MTRPRFRFPLALLIGGALLAVPLCLPALADEPPKSLTERVEREMLRFRVQIQNARIRLEQGLVGPISQEGEPDEPATPMAACCSANLRKMRGAVQEMASLFGELERCHREGGNHGAVASLGFARNDLGEFSRGLQFLTEAPSQEEALGALAGLTRLYFGLEESLANVGECGAGAPPAAEAEPAADESDKEDKSKKKDKKKQDPGEESDG